MSHEVHGEEYTRAEITDFWAMVFNPSSVDRLTHTLVGAFVLGSFFVASVSAFYVLRGRHLEIARRCLSVSLPTALLVTVLAAISGHDSAQKLVDTQPAKLAAMEAHFKTSDEPTGLYLFGWPDAEEETVHFGVRVPRLLSFLVYGDFDTPVPGMDQIAAENRPPVWLPFQTFHLMVALGSLMILLAASACWLWWRQRLESNRLVLWLLVFSPVAAMVANHSGWVTAEVGRQPWIVHPSIQNGVEMAGLRTSDGLSESVTQSQVLSSIVMFGIIYSLLFAIWIFVLNHKIQHGPESPESLAEHKRRVHGASITDALSHGGTKRGGGMLGDEEEEREP